MNQTATRLASLAEPAAQRSTREFDVLHQKASSLRELLTKEARRLNDTPLGDPALDLLEASVTAISHNAELAADLLGEVPAATEADRQAKAALLLQWIDPAENGVLALAASLARDVVRLGDPN